MAAGPESLKGPFEKGHQKVKAFDRSRPTLHVGPASNFFFGPNEWRIAEGHVETRLLRAPCVKGSAEAVPPDLRKFQFPVEEAIFGCQLFHTPQPIWQLLGNWLGNALQPSLEAATQIESEKRGKL